MTLPRFLPTARAALLIALAAPLALLLAALVPGAWVLAPALGALLLVLVLVDAALAGSVEDLSFTTFPDVEVGEESWLEASVRFVSGRPSSAECALALDPRLVAGGRITWPLQRHDDRFQAAAAFTPSRRGTGLVETLWLRWTGPLGLGARVLTKPLGQAVRVWPNLGPVRSPALQTWLRDAQFGMIARRIRGEGAEFEALAEYEPGMDKRRIDWKSSARHARLFAKEFEVERNSQVVFAFDCGQSMCEPVEGQPRIDRAVSAALATAYVALKGGDRVAFYGFAARPGPLTPFISGTSNFNRLQRAAAEFDYHAQEPNFTLGLATLAGRLARRSLIIVFSDFTDPTSAELMVESIGRLVKRHLVLFVTMSDEELEGIAAAAPAGTQEMAMAVTADALLRQRALVVRRLRQIGVDVIEAPHRLIGTRLIDGYMAIKRAGAIG